MQLPIARRPAALLLDAGDTLVFFDGRAMAQALDGLGVKADADALEAGQLAAKLHYQALVASGGNHEDGWSVVVQHTLQVAGVEASHARVLLPALRKIHDEFYFWRRVPEGLPQALGRARDAGISLCVVSNSEGRLAYVLERVGIAQYFVATIDSHHEGVQKPDPEIFRRALARTNARSDQALMAGDIIGVDLEGARGAGIAGVLIDPQQRHVDSAWPRAASVVELIDALLALPEGDFTGRREDGKHK